MSHHSRDREVGVPVLLEPGLDLGADVFGSGHAPWAGSVTARPMADEDMSARASGGPSSCDGHPHREARRRRGQRRAARRADLVRARRRRRDLHHRRGHDQGQVAPARRTRRAVRRRRPPAVRVRDHRRRRADQRRPRRDVACGRPCSAVATWARTRPRSSAAATRCTTELLVRVTPAEDHRQSGISD